MVNVAEMPDFVGDPLQPASDDAPWAAAVAKAYDENKSVTMPDGCKSKITDQIFVGDIDNPSFNGFSMGIFGQGRQLGNNNNRGSQIVTTFDNKPAILLGPGQGMYAGNLSIIGPSGNERAALDPAGVGVGVSSAGGGGTSRFTIENMWIDRFYTGVQTGLGGGALADSGTIRKCVVNSAYYGITYGASQNYIQGIDACQINAKIGVYNPFGLNVHIKASNISGVASCNADFEVLDVSDLTPTHADNTWTYELTVQLGDVDPASPDESVPGSGETNLAAGRYDIGAMVTAHFGAVPVKVVGWDADLRIMSLQIRPAWSRSHFGNTEAGPNTDLVAELQAVTNISLAELLTVLKGASFLVESTHVENATGVSCLIDTSIGFNGGSGQSILVNEYNNFDIGTPLLGSRSIIQAVHPVIDLVHRGVTLNCPGFSTNPTSSPWIVDVANTLAPLDVINNSYTDLGIPNTRCVQQTDSVDAEGSARSGWGTYARTPFAPATLKGTDFYIRSRGISRGPFSGWFPSRGTHPRITAAQLTALQGTPPTFVTGGDNNFPLLDGGTYYSVDGSLKLIKSTHNNYSHGQPLTTTNVTNLAWSYKGQSPFLYVNEEAFERLFSGLEITLDNGTDAPFSTVINGLYPLLGYVSVAGLLVGDKDTTFTGDEIGQAAYAIETLEPA